MNSSDLVVPSPIRLLADPLFEDAGVRVFLKRDDLIHPDISGNKWRKLKYNFEAARQQNAGAIITFGGAYSNHLFALASLGRMTGFRTIGIVRGEELHPESSPTLRHCAANGMELHFVTRTEYREKEAGAYCRRLSRSVSNPFVVPEGGSNRFALPGVAEIVDECAAAGIQPDYFVVPAGTGGTTAGILSKGENVIAIAVLKGAGFLLDDIDRYLAGYSVRGKLDLRLDYHFGGYARHNPELTRFIAGFEAFQNIPLEQVYTGKMLYGLYDLVKRGYFARGTTLVAVHTGGLQGKLKPKSS